jgi:hypothetical protein
MTDSVTVMSLSANFLQKTTVAVGHLHQIAFSQKLSYEFEKWYKFSSCIKAQSHKTRPACILQLNATSTPLIHVLNLKNDMHHLTFIRHETYYCDSSTTYFNINTTKKKGKAVPLQAWSGPKGSRKLRFPHFMTMAQDGGKVVSLTHRPPLPPGNAPGIHFC